MSTHQLNQGLLLKKNQLFINLYGAAPHLNLITFFFHKLESNGLLKELLDRFPPKTVYAKVISIKTLSNLIRNPMLLTHIYH